MAIREEAPTLALLALTYAVYFTLPLAAGTWPIWLIVLGLAVAIAMHSSLQHEVLHGHPFPNQMLNDALVFPALGLAIPYLRFKDTHLAHHFDANLTDPYDDPESYFLHSEDWGRMPPWQQWLAEFNNMLIGRMAVGPAIGLAVLYSDDLGRALKGDRRVIWSYLHHLLGAALPLAWVAIMTDLPLWALFIAAYLGMSILKIRTYLEHRAHDRPGGRSVIIEDRGLLALLFLNNNYHAVHHAHPKVVWHQLPAMFARRREHFLRRNGGYTYGSYREIFRRYLFKRKDPVPHPLHGLAEREDGLRPGG
ncbi:MAG: fatty acid desaturase [Pseudomonadota bacterium]